MPTTQDWNDLLNRKDVIIVDTETTGLGKQAELVQMSALNTRGKRIFNLYFQPQGSIDPKAARIHGLTEKKLQRLGAKPFPKHYRRIRAQLNKASVLLAWNAPFDKRMFQQTCARYGKKAPGWTWRCAMYDLQAGLKVGYRPKLEAAARDAGWRRRQSHDALDDCRMALHVMQRHETLARKRRPAARLAAPRGRRRRQGLGARMLRAIWNAIWRRRSR